ncbi:MAG TPA: hypothetical protein VH165_17125 [Kofleriaceae bacterium]|jgi:hypothetical protein|nr:hypothetical protein [Kofleriaceae bacterium]
MRILALSSIVTLTAVAGSARADNSDHADYRYHARTHEVAAVEPAHAYAPPQAGATLTKGELALSGSALSAHVGVHGLDATEAGDPDAAIARRDPFLTHREITAGVAPHAAEIEHCYLAQGGAARGGHLDVTLVIGRDGNLVSLGTTAAGLSPKATHKLAACVRDALETVEFPERRNDTTAVVPYEFQKTNTPGAGPIMSCWSAKGC